MLARGWGKPSGRIWHWTCWHKLASRPSICPLSFLFAHFKERSSWLGSWLRHQFCLWKQASRLTLWMNVQCPNNHPDSWSLHLLEVSPCSLCLLLLCDSVAQWAQSCSEPARSCSTLQIDNPAICWSQCCAKSSSIRVTWARARNSESESPLRPTLVG